MDDDDDDDDDGFVGFARRPHLTLGRSLIPISVKG
jgi:hypothetical protein